MKFRFLVFLLAFAGITGVVFLVIKQEKKVSRTTPVVLPSINPFENAVAASGIIEARSENVAIGIPSSGLITEVKVKVWDRVEKDDPLFHLDNRELLAQLDVHQANLRVATANLNRLQDQLKRLKEAQSADPRIVSIDEVQTRENDVLVSSAYVEMAAAQLKQTEVLLDRLIIRAPKNGVVLQSIIHKGEFVAQNPLIPAVLLGDLDHLQVRVDIDEQNAWQVKGNEKAVAYLKNNPSLSIPLHFVRIEPYMIPKKSLTGASEERVDTRVLQVIFSFVPPQDFPVYVGQQVDVFIHINKN